MRRDLRFFGRVCLSAAGALLGWAALFAAPAAMAATVGPRDGRAGPSLPPVATPASMTEAWLPDWAYTDKLLAEGDWHAALALYQDYRWRTSGNDNLRATLGAAAMHEKLGQRGGARNAYRAALALLPEEDRRYTEILARMVDMEDDLQAKMDTARRLMPFAVRGDAWAKWGIWQAARAEALATRRITETYGLPDVEDLQARIDVWWDDAATRRGRAAALATLPGLGMLYLGDWRSAAGAFGVWVFVLLMVAGTSNRQHWGAAVWWWLVLAAIMLSTPTLAANRATEIAERQWRALVGETEAP